MTRRIEYMPLDGIRPATKNVKAHDIGAINQSMGRFGYVEAVQLDERTERLVAGHGRLDTLRAMRKDNQPAPPGVEVRDGAWWVPVARGWASKDDAEAKAYLIASNRLVELGGWDEAARDAVLQELAQAGEDALAGTGYDTADVDRLLSMADHTAGLDETPPIPVEPWVKLGDLFQLGDHRLLCGDSTQMATFELGSRLMGQDRAACMWTDPPYGVEYKGAAGSIKNDTAAGLPTLLRDSFAAVTQAFAPGAALYVASPAGPLVLVFMQSFVQAGWRFHETLVWAKDAFVLGHSDYHYKHEPLFYGYAQGGGRRGRGGEGWYGGHDQSSILEAPRPRRSEEHPTMKPVELIAKCLRNSSARGDIVVEPFSGSGSTLVACESLGRRCRAVELDPRFVQVTLERWAKMTGREFVKIE